VWCGCGYLWASVHYSNSVRFWHPVDRPSFDYRAVEWHKREIDKWHRINIHELSESIVTRIKCLLSDYQCLQYRPMASIDDSAHPRAMNRPHCQRVGGVTTQGPGEYLWVDDVIKCV